MHHAQSGKQRGTGRDPRTGQQQQSNNDSDEDGGKDNGDGSKSFDGAVSSWLHCICISARAWASWEGGSLFFFFFLSFLPLFFDFLPSSLSLYSTTAAAAVANALSTELQPLTYVLICTVNNAHKNLLT